KGKFLFFIGTKPGERAMDLLPDLVREVLDALPIPRRMHWGEGTAMFVRPVHWVVMLLGSEVVPATLLDTPAGHFTRGHRFHAPPREVLISTLAHHQRYFPVENASGRLLPAFIAVSNIESRDPAKVREGNERVVRARLADAAFFWEQDRKQPLAARAPALDAVTFQAKLGS